MTDLTELLREKTPMYLGYHIGNVNKALSDIAMLARRLKLVEQVREPIQRFADAARGSRETANLEAWLLGYKSEYESFRQLVLGLEDLPDTSQVTGLLETMNEELEIMGTIVLNPLYEEEHPIWNIILYASDEIPAVEGDKDTPGWDDRYFMKSNMKGAPKHHCAGPEVHLLFYNIFKVVTEAMTEGRVTVDIEHKPDDGYATISMQNKGIMTDENIEKLRESKPFSTEDREGLKIVYDVLNKYKGALRVSSDSRAKTTRFEIDLPYKR